MFFLFSSSSPSTSSSPRAIFSLRNFQQIKMEILRNDGNSIFMSRCQSYLSLNLGKSVIYIKRKSSWVSFAWFIDEDGKISIVPFQDERWNANLQRYNLLLLSDRRGERFSKFSRWHQLSLLRGGRQESHKWKFIFMTWINTSNDACSIFVSREFF